MWKVVRKADLLDEEPYWYMEADDERTARVDLARSLRCKPDDLKTVAKQPEYVQPKKRQHK